MAEVLSFQAEVQQLLDLVIHSLYSDREIFLRELISNASDAIDRARFESLQRTDLSAAEGEPGIELNFSAALGTITVSDNGIGMTREQAIKNLGTIAHSGTKAFVNMLKEKNTSAEGLIGQFGVGFYASFMVADKVTVHTLSAEPGAEPVIWTSTGDGTFTIEPGTRTSRGTEVTLHLRSDCTDFADKYRLKDIVEKHSNFVQYPVLLDGERLNESVALWTRSPQEVTSEEYIQFYKHTTDDWEAPGAWVHFRSEAPLEFASVLYFPNKRPFDLDHPDVKRGLKLYQRRVLVLEHAEQFLPRYLRFVRGVVDAPEVSLNVSREMIQNTPVVNTIRKQLVKRVLRRLREWTTDEPEAYTGWWEQFGAALKEGIAEDGDNKDAILPLLRFRTTTSDGWRDLPTIKAELKEGQDAIWYITGLDLERLKNNPQLERFKRKGWEVLLLSDAVDEWVVMNLPSYDGVPIKSVARGDLKDEDPIAEEAAKEAAPFTGWLGTLLKGEVADVRASGRLTDSPAVLVDGEKGVSANMERILKAARQDVPKAERILEVNPEHPLVRKLAALQKEGKTEEVEPFARLLLDYARVAEGTLQDTAGFAARLQKVLEKAAL